MSNYRCWNTFFNSIDRDGGNSTSSVNYGAWGSYLSLAPLSGFKTCTYEGGSRPPFIIKEPSTIVSPTAKAAGNVINSFVFVTDLTPTFLDYARVSPPGATYKGHEVHPIMGKSIKPLLEGTTDRVHGINEPVGTEMFNSTGLYMGDWVVVHSGSNPTNPWELYNFVKDPAQNNNVADENPTLLQTMVSAYQNYSNQVGIVIPTGDLFALQVAHLTPSFNDTQTVQMDFILPETLSIAKALLQNGTFVAES